MQKGSKRAESAGVNFFAPGGLEPPTFRLTAERANRLRHGDNYIIVVEEYIVFAKS